jgi:glutamate dehydrogenase
MINRTGSVFVHRMQEETGASSEEVTRAFILVRDIFGLEALWSEIDALDNKVPAALQTADADRRGDAVMRATLWFLRRRRERMPIAEVLAIFQPAVIGASGSSGDLLAGRPRAWEAYATALKEKGVPAPLAERLAPWVRSTPRSTSPSRARAEARPRRARVALLRARGELQLRWFAEKITQLPRTRRGRLSRGTRCATIFRRSSARSRRPWRRCRRIERPGPPMLAAWKERYGGALGRLGR